MGMFSKTRLLQILLSRRAKIRVTLQAFVPSLCHEGEMPKMLQESGRKKQLFSLG